MHAFRVAVLVGPPKAEPTCHSRRTQLTLFAKEDDEIVVACLASPEPGAQAGTFSLSTDSFSQSPPIRPLGPLPFPVVGVAAGEGRRTFPSCLARPFVLRLDASVNLDYVLAPVVGFRLPPARYQHVRRIFFPAAVEPPSL